jgi:carbon-monoxide dehydrogenase medium subunit
MLPTILDIMQYRRISFLRVKPSPFEYLAPTSVGEVLSALSQFEGEAKVLAGGQSLIPSMNFRLIRPRALVDINRIAELGHAYEERGAFVVGALVRHAALAKSVTTDPLGKLLNMVVPHVGHYPIRVRGTFVGSMAHADPAAEWCILAMTLGAEMVARSTERARVIPAEDFFQTVFTTALEPTELLTEVRIPLLGPTARIGFQEFSRRAGDFALAAAMAIVFMDQGRIRDARVGLGGVAGRPVRAKSAEQVLRGAMLERRAFQEAADLAAQEVDPLEDIHGSREYRRRLVRVLVHRALLQTIET